jgi:molybdopterin-guanine dinucleotide biosynthesis protein
MKLVMVGGHTRNIGKTSVIEGIIRGLPELNWTAVKITQFGHGVCSVGGQPCGCAVAEHQFSISEERQRDSGTDTARFLAAGARRAMWVRTRQGELFEALPSFRKQIESDEFVIVESNSLRKFIKPILYLQVVDPFNPDLKLSSQELFDLSDAYLLVSPPRIDDPPGTITGAQNILLEREIRKDKSCFAVSAEERFMNQAIINFVRLRLASEDIYAAR